MAEETAVQIPFVGPYTAHWLEDIDKGRQTIGSLLRVKRTSDQCFARNSGDRACRVSYQEAISILEQRRPTDVPPKVLIAHLTEYQAGLEDIEQDPLEYFSGPLTPEKARAWYEQQIARIRRQLQTHSAVSAEG